MTMTQSLKCSRRRRSDGFILVAVLWMLGGLATLALIYSAYLGDSTLALSVNDERIVSESLVLGAVELAAYHLLDAEPEKRPTHGTFSTRLGDANVRVDFISEAARIDLNAAPKELLSGLFVVLGAREPDAGLYADRIIGWRTTPKPGAQDTETSFYRAAGLAYSARGAPFAHASELWLVAGLPPALVERTMPFVTVFSGRPDIDIRDAAPEVIAALPPGQSQQNPSSAGPNAAAQSAQASAGNNGAPAGGGTGGGNAFRLQVHLAFVNGQRTASEIVILLDGDDDPYHILAWRDDVAP
jgi:general secretion pathway protein K